MSEQLPGWEEAERRYRDSRWEIETYPINDSICVRIHRGLITIPLRDIYVKEPNWLERRLNITFEQKIKNAINKQQKRCDKFNAEIVKGYELEAKTNEILDRVKVTQKYMKKKTKGWWKKWAKQKN